MDIFVDSADVEEIKEAMESGVIDGVTTNPSLIKRASEKHNVEDMKKYIGQIFALVNDLPVSLEVTETTLDAMRSEAHKLTRLFKKHKNLVVKIPINPSSEHSDRESFDGLKLIKELSAQGISVNCTLVMSPEQAVLAAKAGATYVSPFAGRIDDYIREKALHMRKDKDWRKHDYFPAKGVKKNGKVAEEEGIVSGVDLVEEIVKIFENYGFKCKVLAASARNPREVREFMLAGADVVTLPFIVLKELTGHYLTVEGVNAFAEDTVEEYKELLKDDRKFSINVKKE